MSPTIVKLLELIRFSHTLFALPFALLAAEMAWFAWWQDLHAESDRVATGVSREVVFRPQELVGILCCMVFARSTAMAFNRIVDRRFDAENPRTANRHLPAGTLRMGQVIAFAVFSAIGFVASTLWFLPNILPLLLSIPVLAVLLGYSYSKRFTSLAHVWLGVALALAPIAAWIAIRGQVLVTNPTDLLPACLLGGAVLFWVAGFDILYACQDAAFDRQRGLRSIPARWGVPRALHVAAGLHFVCLIVLAVLVIRFSGFGPIFACALGGVALLLAYEHAIVRPDDLSRVNRAFFNVNAVISLGLLAVGTLELGMATLR